MTFSFLEKTWEEHNQHVEQVFSSLKDHGLYANKEKLSFGMETINYFGYVIDSEGVHVDLERI